MQYVYISLKISITKYLYNNINQNCTIPLKRRFCYTIASDWTIINDW